MSTALAPAIARPHAAATAAHRYKWPIAFGVTLAAILELVDTSIVNVALSQMSANLGATLDEVTWVAVAYILASVIVLPATGWFASRFGRKRYFLTSITIFTVASVCCGLSSSLNVLIVWRIIQGLGGGALISTSQAILFDTFPPAEKATASAVFGIGAMLGPALGPTLGGIIVEHYTWPWIFLVNIPFGILAYALTAKFYRKDPPRTGVVPPIDVLGFALLAIGLGALQFVLERGEHYDWFESHLIISLAVTATIALVTLIWWELHTRHPVLDLRVLRHPSLTAACMQMFAAGMALYGSVFALPLYMQSLLGFNAESTGWQIFPSAVASGITMMATARVLPRIHPRVLVALGMIVLASSMFMHATLTTQSGSPDLYLPVIMRGMGFGLIFVPITTGAFATLTARDVPAGAALFNLLRQLGGSVGIAMVATQLTTATARHRAQLVEHVVAGAPLTDARVAGLTRYFLRTTPDSLYAARRALAALDHQVEAQANMLAFRDAFTLLGAVVLLSIPLVFLLRRPKGTAAPAADVH
ncbi:MAG TPA: DHA2 family efflux MFS transporter permease subunit [Gemmatimonadaceae bacterium]|nr:DHA2 family efflux MFS transporter permease subunit [Gemmatimonadaceae bacterium]